MARLRNALCRSLPFGGFALTFYNRRSSGDWERLALICLGLVLPRNPALAWKRLLEFRDRLAFLSTQHRLAGK
jgi:hypothetical protein